uniref:Uncharacterized protein n=1 Tax=Candidatus Methanogaster sp. ANME-2c ERB4 TaxID=2759911 RepID=A0A7G9YMX7_9EURY|nr:hypothetical protein ICHGDBFH_00016 [Methanosarcinales archaeon ANME-2c ERB4]
MMKKILLICILLLSFAPNAVGSPQYAMQEVVIGAYLVDLSYNVDEGTAIARETIVFVNNGDTNHTDTLCVAIPENAEVMHVSKMDMGDSPPAQVTHERNGEILCWNTTIAPGSMAMYTLTYVMTITESGEFVKNLDPAVANYPISAFRLKVNTDVSIEFTDGVNNAITPDETSQEEDGGVLYSWAGPLAFKELHVKTSQPQPSSMDKWIVYGIIAVLIIAALSYPIIHVRNNRLRAQEGGNKLSCASCSACSGDDENDKEPRGGDWDEMDEIITEISQTEEDLIRKKRAILAVLNKLEEDRDAGAVSDADYKRLSSKYEKQAIAIMKQLDRM